jgi:quercetin dioxygenase-like cupin family protein
MNRTALVLVAMVWWASAAPAGTVPTPQATPYARSSAGTRALRSRDGLAITVLLERSNFSGGELEVAEITLPPSPNAGSHRHASSEILYILSGELDHVVNDTSHGLRPGMLGIVRPGDRVAHRVRSTEPVRALVIWEPGGEVDRIARSPAFVEESLQGGSRRR